MAMEVDERFAYLLEIAREPVTSSNVADIGYHKEDGIIVVGFTDDNDSVYGYLSCSPREYKQLEEAASKGQFVNRRLKGIKECVRIA